MASKNESKITDFKDKAIELIGNFSKGEIAIAVIGVCVTIFGLSVLLGSTNAKLNNYNDFQVPSNAAESQSTVLTVTSENIKGLNFKSLTENPVNVAKGQHTVSFVLSNAKDKLTGFKKDNVSQEFFGMKNGAPDYKVDIYSISAYPIIQNSIQLKMNDGSLLYKGYTSFDDLNKGVNKKTFLISGGRVLQLKDGKTIATNIGNYKITQEG